MIMLFTVCVKKIQKELYIISHYSKIKHCCSKAVYITFKVIFYQFMHFFATILWHHKVLIMNLKWLVYFSFLNFIVTVFFYLFVFIMT